jgi:uncharacterized protein YegL
MKNLTDITIILDRSASMEIIKEATIKGLNTFLDDHKQKHDPLHNNTKISLVQFDHEYQMIYESIDILDVKYLNNETFIPRGSTSLLDAIGKTITDTKNRLNLLPEKQKPNDVLIVIVTDGEENSSNKYTRDKIFKMISKREKKNNWKFIFIGSNQDAISVGGSLGIEADRALTFANDSEGVVDAFRSFSKGLGGMENGIFRFSEEDRETQKR